MTIRSRLAAKLALALALAALLAAEAILPVAPRAGRPLHDAVVAPAPPSPAARSPAGRVRIILARPLFRADRRPVALAATAPVRRLPRLSAIIIARGDRRAIFAGRSGKAIVIGTGGRVGGYRLDAIAADRVSLIGPDGRITLRPQFSDGVAATGVAVAGRR